MAPVSANGEWLSLRGSPGLLPPVSANGEWLSLRGSPGLLPLAATLLTIEGKKGRLDYRKDMVEQNLE